jgi:hypothetical protein
MLACDVQLETRRRPYGVRIQQSNEVNTMKLSNSLTAALLALGLNGAAFAEEVVIADPEAGVGEVVVPVSACVNDGTGNCVTEETAAAVEAAASGQ